MHNTTKTENLNSEQNHKTEICQDRIKSCRINIKLRAIAVNEQEFIYTREDISILRAHFRVTWFPKGNIILCRK